MENAGLSVETGPPDQLDQAFQLDFESNAELEAFEAEGLDFGLDGPYEEVENGVADEVPADSYAGFDHILTGHLPDDAAVEPELEHTGPEVAPPATNDETAQTTEAIDNANGADDDAKADGAYQDEIGYEDDELLATEANVELSNTEADETEIALADTLSEGNPVPVPVTDDGGHLEESLHGNDVSWDQDVDFQGHDESIEAQDPLDDANTEETPPQPEGNGVAIDTFDDEATRGHPVADYRGFNLEKVLDDIMLSRAKIPDIEVLYNQECYSLFGTSEDDSDSYFLSGVEELDCPLSQFLSALRAVISDEIAATDELVIRFDPLELEFGERSNEKFLNRTFREILDCHSALGQVPGAPADPVLHLTVRRDSEEHFLELLSNASRFKGSPSSAEDSEMSENHEEESRANDLDYEQAQDEAFEDGNMDEYYDEGGHADADHEEQGEPESALSHDQSSGEQRQDDQFDVTAPQTSDAADVASGDEGRFEIPSAEGPSHDTTDDGAGEEQAWDGQATEDDTGAASQHPEIPVEETDEVNNQPTEQQGDEVTETAGFGAVDEDAASNDGVSEQEAGSNGKSPSFLSPTPPISLYNSPVKSSPPPVQEKLSVSAPVRVPSSIGVNEEAPWDIDYSDDEYEHTPGSNLESKTSPPLQIQGQSPISRFLGTNFNRTRGSSVGSFYSSKASEPSDVSMTFSVDVDANGDAHQDDDLILAFDDEPGLSAIHEGADEHEDTITYDDLENPDNDAEDVQEPLAAGTFNESIVEPSENGGHDTAVAETASIHTSTTMNGDEIDYDADDTADGVFTPANDDAQQSAAASGDDKDEIDWENDEDEYEQQPAIENAGADYEESKEVPLTPPSVAGKRSRADETESLAEETGMPPPAKRLRLH
ncbi:hypothetical protein CHGG_03151 [Chaetomium globosum CBS 148.51]|uniref:Uncharacterized protein n=1 Tax=Chaetomium globosum (strain ATCC 6205 / CBS 148.51 / DSM 1962 / NBRC 6347 / NRRL 1970) TaxID=306901 RepID=Q2H9F3_CHAGB|nr:uncharacterized protein CHGG_03151 [Chaetomium globosum CBS 148.51]EAQ91216.1 hypothetical protein CHGG_03151 [Chaetomium globosum CBS 148.51]